MASIAIFINRFNVGVTVNAAFVTLLSMLLYQDWLLTEYSSLVKLRFILTLMHSVVCAIF
ncbi:hypothetical protein JCM19233_2085 [Vibrio astriarenae]|nr:hypothetical protein JCM19233_2085 [Vibrio sp. C7]